MESFDSRGNMYMYAVCSIKYYVLKEIALNGYVRFNVHWELWNIKVNRSDFSLILLDITLCWPHTNLQVPFLVASKRKASILWTCQHATKEPNVSSDLFEEREHDFSCLVFVQVPQCSKYNLKDTQRTKAFKWLTEYFLLYLPLPLLTDCPGTTRGKWKAP